MQQSQRQRGRHHRARARRRRRAAGGAGRGRLDGAACARARWCRSSRTARCAISARCDALARRARGEADRRPRRSRCSSPSRSTSSTHTRAPAFADRRPARSTPRSRWCAPAAKALVNALLRRYLRERDALDARVRAATIPSRAGRTRSWWIDARAARLSRALAGDPRRRQRSGRRSTLRVNVRATTRDDAPCALRARPASPRSRRARRASSSTRRGRCRRCPASTTARSPCRTSARSSRRRCSTCDDGMRVLDACAAPGGKTTHIARAGRRRARRARRRRRRGCARVRENLARLALRSPSCASSPATPRTPRAWWDGGPFDRILADVPCTASGIVRRHPDGKWLRRATDVGGFAREQRALLDGAVAAARARRAAALRHLLGVRGGKRGADRRVHWQRRPDALRETLSFPAEAAHAGGQLLPSRPGAGHNQDGFFYALLRKALTLRMRRRRSRHRCARSAPPAADAPRSARPPPACPVPARASAAARRRAPSRSALLAAARRADARSRSARAPTRSRALGGTARVEEGEVLLNADSTSRSTPTLEEALQKGIPLYFVARVRARRGRAGTGSTRRSRNGRSRTASRTAPLTRQYRVAQRPACADASTRSTKSSASSAA